MKIVFSKVLGLAVVLGVAALACGDDDDTNNPAAPGADGGTSGSTPTGDAAAADPRYLVSTTVFGADGNALTYFGSVADISTGNLDLTQALEVPGMAKLYAREGLGWFALGSGEEPTVTRYEVGTDGALIAGATISFQPQGTSFLGDMMTFISDTKAYYYDAPNAQIIKWNPTAMTVDGTIDLGQTVKPDLTTIYALKPLLRADGTLLFPVTWRNFETDASFAGTGLVVIDTNTDTLRKYTENTGCQGVTWSAITSDGTLYAATTPYYAVLQRVSGNGPSSCALRILPTSDDFDPTFKVDLNALAGGRIAGGLATGPTGELFFRAIGTDLVVGPDTVTADAWSDAIWRWYRWNLSSNAVTPIDTLPLSSAGGLTYDLDGKTYATDSAADFSSTTLIDMTAEGGPREALKTQGYVYGLARAR